jgi:nicotinamidase-related amidase
MPVTTLHDRPHQAVLVIDFQNGVIADVYERDRVAANINQLIDKARAANVAVIWVQDVDGGRDQGSEAWQITPELRTRPDEPRVQKSYGDAFEATDLEELLAAAGIGKLFVAGAQTDACIRSTLHGAVTRGYDTILVGDAHTTEDLTEWGNPSPAQVIAHTNLYWRYHSAPDREVGVLNTAEVSFEPR